jgi:hypothetical protein
MINKRVKIKIHISGENSYPEYFIDRALKDRKIDKYTDISGRSRSTCYHQLRDTTVKVITDVGVEFRHIYLLRRHNTNDAPQHKSLSPNYKMKERGPPRSCGAER